MWLRPRCRSRARRPRLAARRRLRGCRGPTPGPPGPKKFKTVLDCGLFHTFDSDERRHPPANLASMTVRGGNLYMLCFSDAGPDCGPASRQSGGIEVSVQTQQRLERVPPSVRIGPDEVRRAGCTGLAGENRADLGHRIEAGQRSNYGTPSYCNGDRHLLSGFAAHLFDQPAPAPGFGDGGCLRRFFRNSPLPRWEGRAVVSGKRAPQARWATNEVWMCHPARTDGRSRAYAHAGRPPPVRARRPRQASPAWPRVAHDDSGGRRVTVAHRSPRVLTSAHRGDR
jgi:hypothetical protein